MCFLSIVKHKSQLPDPLIFRYPRPLCSSKKGSLAAFLEDLAVDQLPVCVILWEVQNRSCPVNSDEKSRESRVETLCHRCLSFPLGSQNTYLFHHLRGTGSVKIMFHWSLPSSKVETESSHTVFYPHSLLQKIEDAMALNITFNWWEEQHVFLFLSLCSGSPQQICPSAAHKEDSVLLDPFKHTQSFFFLTISS